MRLQRLKSAALVLALALFQSTHAFANHEFKAAGSETPIAGQVRCNDDLVHLAYNHESTLLHDFVTAIKETVTRIKHNPSKFLLSDSTLEIDIAIKSAPVVPTFDNEVGYRVIYTALRNSLEKPSAQAIQDKFEVFYTLPRQEQSPLLMAIRDLLDMIYREPITEKDSHRIKTIARNLGFPGWESYMTYGSRWRALPELCDEAQVMEGIRLVLISQREQILEFLKSGKGLNANELARIRTESEASTQRWVRLREGSQLRPSKIRDELHNWTNGWKNISWLGYKGIEKAYPSILFGGRFATLHTWQTVLRSLSGLVSHESAVRPFSPDEILYIANFLATRRFDAKGFRFSKLATLGMYDRGADYRHQGEVAAIHSFEATGISADFAIDYPEFFSSYTMIGDRKAGRMNLATNIIILMVDHLAEPLTSPQIATIKQFIGNRLDIREFEARYRRHFPSEALEALTE